MKKTVLLLLATIFTTTAYCQTDTIFTNNEKIICSVREITPEAVKFCYPDEDILNSVYKNSVQKIVFKNGRVQTFAEATSYKQIKGVDDFDQVTVTKVESEVKGLFKLGEVSAKAKGTTTLSNMERVKERAYKKMKIVAAMMGANIIYLTDQQTSGNKAGNEYEPGNSTETNLSGIAYTNLLPSADEFKNLIKDQTNFTIVEETKLWSSASDMTKTPVQNLFVISSVTVENGLIYISAITTDNPKKPIKYRVVSFNNQFFNVFYETKSTSYNLKIKI